MKKALSDQGVGTQPLAPRERVAEGRERALLPAALLPRGDSLTPPLSRGESGSFRSVSTAGTRRFLKSLLGLCVFVLASCAVITVNVYFPEKAAKEAYKSLDDMLLKTGEQPADGKAPGSPPAQPKEKPQSRIFDEVPTLSFVSEAVAAEADADALAVELSSMPEVLAAYDEMSKRLPRLTALFDSGAVGLSKQGLVVPPPAAKAKLSAQDEGVVASENQNRKTVVQSMAKAILKLQNQKESKEALNLVLPRAATTYAETKREAAKPGWWMQLPNDRWVQK